MEERTSDKSRSGKGRRAVGNVGEDLAGEFLEKNGMKILKRNYTIRGGEIDLIALDKGQTLVFVEVKFRRNGEFGSGEEAIGPVKQKRLINAAERFIFDNDMGGFPARFDAVIIEGGKLRHIKNAFGEQ